MPKPGITNSEALGSDEKGTAMNRDEAVARLEERRTWDFIVIGGGATGLGTAVDAAARGYTTLLVDQGDFARGTSSRSTKLIHGGVRDLETDSKYTLKARVVINATGPFCDAIRRMDEPTARPMIRPSQGVHIVLDPAFLPGDSAIMVPHTDDGRMLFAVPWHGRIIVGTTDPPLNK